MCCGAIMACGISTVVIGARPIGSANMYGDYRMEGLVEMAGQGGQVTIIDGILEAESREVRY
jgi:tRNA(Arg) A34 adenosine deaminase TadA